MAEAKDRRVMWFWLWFLAGVALVIAYAVKTLFFAAPSEVQQGSAGAPSVADVTGRPQLELTIEGAANGVVVIELYPDLAPQHVAQVTTLAKQGAYDGVVFHRVIDGFMAQTGDVQFGKIGGDMSRAGMGGSELPDIPAEFSDVTFGTGTVGMARGSNTNSANSQFFIMLAPGDFLDGKYTVIGQIKSGFDVVDAIKRGEGQNGAVVGQPDVMTRVRVLEGD